MGYRTYYIDLLKNGTLAVQFPYDEQMLSIIRQIPGRKYHGYRNGKPTDDKYWSIPRSSLKVLIEQAARHGCEHRVTAKVRKAVALGAGKKAEIEKAKTDESPLEIPTQTSPYPFQVTGIRFIDYALRNFKGALLADDMGLGKTFMALALVARAQTLNRVLVLVPNSLKYVWAAEIDKHFPQLTYQVIDGHYTERAIQWANVGPQVIIANYDLIYRDPEPLLQPWDLAVFDECTKLKNYRTQTHKKCAKLQTRYRLGLSGTPIENELSDLHSIFQIVMPGLLPSWWVFRQDHCEVDRWNNITGYKGLEQVKEKIGPYYLRRRKQEVLSELPEKFYSDLVVDLTSKEWAIYESIQKEIRGHVEDNPKLIVQNVLTEMLRLKQIADDPALVDEPLTYRSAKMAAIADMLEQAGDHKIVYFTQFAEMANLVAAQFDLPTIQGKVKSADRVELVKEFQELRHRALVSTDAGAYGITLTAADIVCHIDLPWNPARVRQREDRLHRIGQKNSVQVVTLMARNTVDSYVRDILHGKLSIAKAVLDDDTDGFDVAENITKEDLLGLLGGANAA